MVVRAEQKRRNFRVARRWKNAGSKAGVWIFRSWNFLKIQGSTAGWKPPAVLFLLFSLYVVFLRTDSGDPFAQPFCDASGVCHERPDTPSPRTTYSAWNKEQLRLWWTYYETLKVTVDDYATKRQALYDGEQDHESSNNDRTRTQPQTRPLILLGDSITEAWSETGLGIPKHRAEGVSQVLKEELSAASGLDPIVLGMSGDQTQHLLYRLQNGHMRAAQLSMSAPDQNKKGVLVPTVGYDPSAVFVVMIGTNNLGSGELPGPTAAGVMAVLNYILQETAAAGCHVMLFQILPRGDGRKVLPELCPPRCSDDATKTPYSSFLPPIETVNTEVYNKIQSLPKADSERVALVDCGAEFVNKAYVEGGPSDEYEVKQGLMPDLLHPNAAGHRDLARCIRGYIESITRST